MFSALSTGAFGYPMEEAARVAPETVVERAPSLDSVRRIRFVLYDDEARRVHARVLEEVGEDVQQGCASLSRHPSPTYG